MSVFKANLTMEIWYNIVAYDLHDGKKVLALADDERKVRLCLLPEITEVSQIKLLFDISEVKFSKDASLLAVLSQWVKKEPKDNRGPDVREPRCMPCQNSR